MEMVTKQQKSCRRIAFLMEPSSPNLRAIRQPQIQRLWSISENTGLAKSSGKQWMSTAHRWVMRMSGGKSRSSNPSRVATLPEPYWPHCAMTGSLRSNSKLGALDGRLVWRLRGSWLNEWDGNGDQRLFGYFEDIVPTTGMTINRLWHMLVQLGSIEINTFQRDSTRLNKTRC
jgi:hypothetical protein